MFQSQPDTSQASSSLPEKDPTSGAAKATKTATRSCIVCRSRKVRCDRLSPCSNCSRANIACVFPSKDRPPRWARNLHKGDINLATATQPPSEMVERVRKLENLVKELSFQLENATASASASSVAAPSEAASPESFNHESSASPRADPTVSSIQKPFGRLVLQDSKQSRYVSSAFWSQVNDDLDDLASESSGEEDEHEFPEQSLPTQESHRSPEERNSFLFGHNLNPAATSLRDFHPLPSQVPFLLDVFSENINSILRIVHVPTIQKMVRESRTKEMTAVNEALMFSIYYATIVSMEEDDIMTNFGTSKSELSLKYRLGLEKALAKSDFLNNPSLDLVQAFAIFLCLVRRQDSPRFVWMMTGLLIRMGQALGLQRDGIQLGNMKPFEIEMRRRTWWAICALDLRASEDQGMDYTIASGSFDTSMPLNINDSDIDPTTEVAPPEREGITDMTFTLVWFESGTIAKKLMPLQSSRENQLSMDEQSNLLNQIYQDLDSKYLQFADTANISYWVGVTVTRLVAAKLTLFIYMPLLFSASSEDFSREMRTKLLVAAVEIAEYNHALNDEQACRHWRWVFQTYSHWYAVVYILIEIARRPWSCMAERAWVALHSQWLMPAQSHMEKSQRIWVPLQKLMAKARKHRQAEIRRLKSDHHAAEQLEKEESSMPKLASPGLYPPDSDAASLFRERWRQLMGLRTVTSKDAAAKNEERIVLSAYDSSHEAQSDTALRPNDSDRAATYSAHAQSQSDFANVTFFGQVSNQHFPPQYLETDQLGADANYPTTLDGVAGAFSNSYPDAGRALDGGANMFGSPISEPWTMAPTGLIPWPWVDMESSPSNAATDNNAPLDFNVNMDMSDIDWYQWVESANSMNWDATVPPHN